MSTVIQPVSALPRPMFEKRPRELGVYRLPDGREFVASTLHADGCALYAVPAWWSYGGAEYWADRDGRILSRGVPTPWRVADLEDTGRTASYPKPNIL